MRDQPRAATTTSHDRKQFRMKMQKKIQDLIVPVVAEREDEMSN
jgi:hypothetical protein